jgi:hypothetical protein
MAVARNSACPCGSGRKYKRCCLAAEKRAAREARFDELVGRRIQDWSAKAFSEEIDAALEEFVGPDRTMDDDDLQIFSTWFHDDRELPGGSTPAERYAARAGLPAEERAAAARIATARLGLHRVLAVEPGNWVLLENIVDGARAQVRSTNVSCEAVRWDILLGRVMDGEPLSLWGPVRFFKPDAEPELLAELRRLGGADDNGMDGAGSSAAFRRDALELMRFTPPGWSVERSFFTLEGDPVVHGQATWHLRDLAVTRARLRAFGGLSASEPLEVSITAPREMLTRDRPPLPEGAIVIEAGPVDDLESVPIATLWLEEGELRAEAMSVERLERAIEIVAVDFGDVAELTGRDLVPIEQRLEEYGSEPPPIGEHPPALDPVDEHRRLGGFMADRMRRWLDDPNPQLEGQTPREAAAGERRAEVVRLVRGIENNADRARRCGEPAAEVAWLRSELAIEDELAA